MFDNSFYVPAKMFPITHTYKRSEVHSIKPVFYRFLALHKMRKQ